MKKIFIILGLLLLLQNVCSAQTNVSFVYINGSNNNNAKMKNWFENGVAKLHPQIKKKIEKNKDMKTIYLKNGDFAINEKPVIFFWGDKSQKDIAFVEQQLELSKVFSPSMAFRVRELIAEYLHDAIWVQKPHHMLPIIDELNNVVKQEYKKGNEVVLYGYSAGTFITYEYLFNKLPYINLQDLFNNLTVPPEVRQYVASQPRKNTCISALAHAHIGIVSSAGKLLVDQNSNRLMNNYTNIDTSTEAVCAPVGAVQGIVNYASPLVLFYSDLADSDYEQTFYNKLMMKYIMENGLFWLTVNFREDPLGFPTTRNLTAQEMSKIAHIEIQDPKGFIYDNSSVWSRRWFLFAHTSYWNANRTFANAVAKSYVNGYKFQYDPEFQEKALKKLEKITPAEL